MGVYPILTFRADWIYPIFGVAILAFCWFLPYVVVSAAAILSKSATKENQSTVQVSFSSLKKVNHYIVRFIKYILDCPYNRRSTRSSIVSILGWPNAKFKMGSFSLATWFYGTLFCFGSLIMASAQTRR